MKKITYTYTHSIYNHTFPCNHPTADRLYVKYLKFISENPGRTRKEICTAVTGISYLPSEKLAGSTEWASITSAGLCEMCRDGRAVRYFITEKGREMLNNLAA